MTRESKNRRWIVDPLWITAILFLAFGVVAVWWLTALPYSEAKCRNQIRTAEPVIAALKSYRQDAGTYPPGLQDLVPKYLPVIPAVDGGDAANRPWEEVWRYERIEANHFVLWTSTNHWISSFDALIYSTAPLASLGNPSDQGRYRAYTIDDWHYVVGAQHLGL